MRRLLVLPALAIALMLMLPGTAEVKVPIKGAMALNFHMMNPIWRGHISGELNGWIEFTSLEGYGKKAWHFGETWEIKDGEGGTVLLSGTDEGVVSPDSKYRMNGVVTYAAEGWTHLLGRNVHASGYITWDSVDPTLPVTAPGTFRIN